jgi:1,4-alpha-glucan branching enzyme
MGANLTEWGATFRVWAPAAEALSVRGSFNNWSDHPLDRSEIGYWSGSIAGVREGDQYKLFVKGLGSTGWKRDAYARALTREPAFPNCNCILTQPRSFPWHDKAFRPPAFSDLIIYQLHVGTYWSADRRGGDRRADRPGRFLDLLHRVEYLAALGINAVQLMPIQEFATMRSLGYNGTDFFSPEMDYSVSPTDPEFADYVDKANALLARHGVSPYAPNALDCQTKQLMAVIDIMHLNGIAVILDVVYNHAGGGFDDESIYFMDREQTGDNNRSLFFTDQGWAGGLVFAYWKQEVRQFIIDNAGFLLDEYHIDGFRFDEVTVIDNHGGWGFLQDLTDTLRYRKPSAPLIAEYWADQSAVLRPRSAGGAGFDAVVAAELRQAIRGAIAEAARGADALVELDYVAAALNRAAPSGWRLVQHVENQDIVRVDNTSDRQPRIPRLADPSDTRSWYARSRSRIAAGLLFTAPGIPMVFMGEEILEDKYWSDSPNYFRDSLIWWDGLSSDRSMQDYLRFIRELIGVRQQLPALRTGALNVYHIHNDNRVIAFHRWIEGVGEDVVVIATLREKTWYSYKLGFPGAGRWREIFNSDTYDNWVNPNTQGNGGWIEAAGPPTHGLPCSVEVTIPANAILIFAR